MKKNLLFLPLLLAGLAVSSCSKYDDSALSSRVTNVEGRVSKLEEQVKALNSDIVSIRALITALESKDYVTKVEPITEGGRLGYRISFTQSNPITIFHGTNGANGRDGANGTNGRDGQNGRDAVSPMIGVRQEEGIYYWTLNGEWLTDAQGQKIKAQGTDGRNGQDGAPGRDGANGSDGQAGRDGVTPKLKIENEYWHVSYDNGKTWQSLNVKARGDKGDAGSSFFQSVEPSSKNQPGYVTFVFADGQRVELPTWYEYERLRTEIGQINRNLQSLQQIVTAVQNRDYLTSVTPYMEASVQRGYTLSFARSGSLVIYHGRNGENGQNGQNGRDGQDGQTPVIGIRKDSDNIYYWTLNGQWLTDAEGRKVKAEGRDGASGATSAGRDGITPQLKIEGEYWHVSYDNGQNWQSLNIKARGEKGDRGEKGEKGDRGEQGVPGRDGAAGASSASSLFTDVQENDRDVTLTLRNGTNVVIPKGSPIAITFAQTHDIRVLAGKKYSIPYTVTGATAQTKIEALAQDGFRAVVKRTNESTGVIEVTAPSTIQESRVLVFVTDGRDRTIMRSIVFVEGVIRIPTKSYTAEFSGGDVVVDLDTNIDYTIRIPEAAQPWVSHISTNARAIMRSERLLFRVKPNTTTQARYTTIDLVDNLGVTSETILINQRGGTTQTIHVSSAGTLDNLISSQDKNLIEDLKLTGTLGLFDYDFLRSMPKLKSLDLSEISNTTISPSAFSGANIPSIILPLNLTAIPDRAFENSKITSIHIPKTVTSIGQRAFAGTSELRGNIIIPDATTSIGASAFENSKFDGKLKLGAQLQTIGEKAFYQGVYTSVEWNERLQTIGSYAFASASKVKGDVTLPNTLTSLGGYAFYLSSFDGNLVLSQELTEIPQEAFRGCKFVGNLTIPDKVERVRADAFSGCDKMTGRLTIGAAVKELGSDAFEGTRFARVYSKVQTPLSNPYSIYDDSAFYQASRSYLGVPRGTRDRYRNAAPWRYFTIIEEVDF